jgi:hypothetical protein
MRVINVVMLHSFVDNNFHVSVTTECFKYYILRTNKTAAAQNYTLYLGCIMCRCSERLMKCPNERNISFVTRII